jgi:hypothetical protein
MAGKNGRKVPIRTILAMLDGFQRGHSATQVRVPLDITHTTVLNYFKKFKQEGFVRGNEQSKRPFYAGQAMIGVPHEQKTGKPRAPQAGGASHKAKAET